MNIKRITSAVSVGFLSVLVMPALASAAVPQTEVVTEADVVRQAENTPPTDNWVIYTRTATPGTATFRNGPATPPLNAGSLELGTTTGSDKVFAFNYDHVGTRLADIDALGYSTYRSAGNLQQVAALNMEVDFNGAAAGGFTTLVFEPVYNTSQGAVTSGVWQDWDAYDGGSARWWSTRAITGTCAFTCYSSWSDIVAANPDATILGGYGVNQGSGNPALTTAVDALSIGTAAKLTTYDFELVQPKPVKATDKDDCKDGGWKEFQTPYKNQGDCVSSVASNGKAKGNPGEQAVSFLRSLFQ